MIEATNAITFMDEYMEFKVMKMTILVNMLQTRKLWSRKKIDGYTLKKLCCPVEDRTLRS